MNDIILCVGTILAFIGVWHLLKGIGWCVGEISSVFAQLDSLKYTSEFQAKSIERISEKLSRLEERIKKLGD